MEQLSEEWFAARCGMITASRISDVMAKTKTGYAASRTNYMAQLIVERLTGIKEEGYSNAAMQWGVDTEPHARDAYKFITDNEVEETGFVLHPTIKMSGASPDGLVSKDGLVEIKCPNTATHIQTLLDEKIPAKYIDQMQWQMECTEREWCDFVSFDPRMPPNLQMFIKRIDRDEKRIPLLRNGVIVFNNEIDKKLEKLRKYK